MEELLPRFRAAHTQVLGVSIDSVFCHANWAKSLGGISYPLLSDFHPKGEVARSYGLYLDDAGITDRATVVIDAKGVVRHASSVTPSGRRNIAELAALAEQVDEEHGSGLPEIGAPLGLPQGMTLYVKSSCGFSNKVLLASENLRLGDRVIVKNVSEDPAARAELEKLVGSDQAPCLVGDDQTLRESDDIVKLFVERCTDIG